MQAATNSNIFRANLATEIRNCDCLLSADPTVSSQDYNDPDGADYQDYCSVVESLVLDNRNLSDLVEQMSICSGLVYEHRIYGAPLQYIYQANFNVNGHRFICTVRSDDPDALYVKLDNHPRTVRFTLDRVLSHNYASLYESYQVAKNLTTIIGHLQCKLHDVLTNA